MAAQTRILEFWYITLALVSWTLPPYENDSYYHYQCFTAKTVGSSVALQAACKSNAYCLVQCLT
jgi:hypothetical protein